MVTDMDSRRNPHPAPTKSCLEPREACKQWRKMAASLKLRLHEVKLPYPWYRWVLILRRKRVVCTLNALLFFVLMQQTINLFRFCSVSHLPYSLPATISMRELPHPMNIVAQVRTHNVAAPSISFSKPRYTSIRNAIFHNRYPSVTLQGTGTFSEVYVISTEQCKEKFREF